MAPGLTKTYFFRLDAHQTTLVRCMFNFVAYFAWFLLICLLFSLSSNVVDNEFVPDVVRQIANMTQVNEDNLKTLEICAGAYTGYVFLNVVIHASVIYAILSSQRWTRWFMVPLFMMDAIDLVFYTIVFVAVGLLLLLVSSNFLPASLWTAIAFVFFGINIIGFQAAIESFSNFGSEEHGSDRLESFHHSEVPYGRILTVHS